MHITSLFHAALAWGSLGLHVKALVRNVPVAHHRRVQNNGFELQHGCAMTSMNKVYCYAGNSKLFILIAWHIYQPVNTQKIITCTLELEWILFYLATNKVLLIRKQAGNQWL